MAEMIPVYDDETYPIVAPTFEALADLYVKALELDTEALTKYAKSKGFKPPRDEDADYWDIVTVLGVDGGYVCLAWDAPDSTAGKTWTPGSEEDE